MNAPSASYSAVGTVDEGTDVEDEGRIRRAQSCAADVRDAVREFHAAIVQKNMALVMFFCSVDFDLDVLASEMRDLFAGVQVVGCTTAGEIGPAGYRDHGITGASFPSGSFTATCGHLDKLQQFESIQAQSLAQDLLQELEGLEPQADTSNSFGFLLIDGLSVREEPVARSLQNAFGKLPLVGGSAGDGLGFARTQVPFRIFKTQHFVV